MSYNTNTNEVAINPIKPLTPQEQKEKEKTRRLNEVEKTLSIVVRSYIPSKNGTPVINPENFIKSAKKFVSNSTVFEKTTDKNTIVSALLHCASDGLLPDGRQSTFVNYSGKLTYVPMYQGLIEIIYRGGSVQSVNTHIIQDNDTFEVLMGTEEKITHIPNVEKNGKKIAVYAVATLIGGGKVHCLLRREEVEAIKEEAINKLKKKKNPDDPPLTKEEQKEEEKRIANSPWTKYEDEMWKKTAIRRLYKILPKSNNDIVQQRSPEEYEGYVPVIHDDVIDISHMKEAPATIKVTNVNATLEEITNA